MGDILTGGNAISGDRLSYQEINEVKNHFYGPDPPAGAVAGVVKGVIWVDSDDDRVYVYDGTNWILQTPYSVDDWEPGITFGGNDNNLTYNTRGGRYVRLGDWVTLTGWIFLSSKGDSNGDARIVDLPFTCKNSPFNFACPSLRLENIRFENQWTSFVQKNTKTIELQEVTEAGTRTALTDANFDNDSTIIISVTYEIEVP